VPRDDSNGHPLPVAGQPPDRLARDARSLRWLVPGPGTHEDPAGAVAVNAVFHDHEWVRSGHHLGRSRAPLLTAVGLFVGIVVLAVALTALHLG
jgi:uncharacterized protein with von Willebrand factor type A (vWA) domain